MGGGTCIGVGRESTWWRIGGCGSAERILKVQLNVRHRIGHW